MRVKASVYQSLKKEIVGPSDWVRSMQLNHEEILRAEDPPTQRYSAGILFPQKIVSSEHENTTEPEVIELTEATDPDDTDDASHLSDSHVVGTDTTPDTDQDINRTNEYMPSAMGLSVIIRVPDNRIRVRVFAGRYSKREIPGAGRFGLNGLYRPYIAWWRQQLKGSVDFNHAELCMEETVSIRKPVTVDSAETGLEVYVLSRPFRGSVTDRILTITLLNTNTRGLHGRSEDELSFFQCGFRVYNPDNTISCFLEYPEKPDTLIRNEDSEERSLRLLYRHRKTYAIGHGCAANWRKATGDATRSVWTEVLPRFEVNPVLPRDVSGIDLSMLFMSRKTDRNAIVESCRLLSDEYESWISDREKDVNTQNSIPDDLTDTAKGNLNECRSCLRRIRSGIDLLETSDSVWRAFTLMNRAMHMQNLHYRLASEPECQRNWVERERQLVLERPFACPDYTAPSRSWRPFQLAFILMNLGSMVCSSEAQLDERQIVDLIWFPTGGGKTEAYLGLAAYTIFLRRLCNPDNAGTAVLMRYTLRLLTTQQYQRAASLICACERIRRELYDSGDLSLGSERITIGLWVGDQVTPGKRSDAVTSLEQMLEGDANNPFVILNCPWCGAQMGSVRCVNHTEVKGYRRVPNPKRVIFRCSDPDCDFSGSDGLPLLVVDEDIYGNPPALIIGTVDKFAMLPWKPESRAIFGLDRDGISPPELIIQDELHLISGPLGSMVGHYETVIDKFCTRRDSHPAIPAKIVASTATISRAGEQICSLYARDPDQVSVFPVQGLNIADSFFAVETNDKPGRTYVGVFGSAASSHITTQIRVMSALLQSVKCVSAASPDEIDPYWTLVSYFNSLRELGHAATLLRADIPEYMNVVWERMGLIHGDETAARRRFINRDCELTSRITNAEIPEILKSLFTRYDGNDYSGAVDVCLATNMIQVGIDVPRLSLMTIVGQPKTTSEYIQASSRVGRSVPGLVVTVFSTSKPRDRSHYEHFRSYHESIYRYVEPASVTPFAVPVRERALHALVFCLARTLGGESIRNSPFPKPSYDLFQRIRSIIEARVAVVDPDEHDGTLRSLEAVINRWQREVFQRYGDFGVAQTDTPAMYPGGSTPKPSWHGYSYATPTSMRDVDANCDAGVMENPNVFKAREVQ